jgi:hypothetical protein
MSKTLAPDDLLARILQLEKRVKQLELNDPVVYPPHGTTEDKPK